MEEVDEEEEKVEKAVEVGEEGGPPEGPPEAVAAGEERPDKEFEEITAGEKTIWLQGEELERGLYWVRVVRDDGKVFEWPTGIKGKAESIHIERIHIHEDLAGRKIEKLEIYKYDKVKHFPKYFELFGHRLYFDPATNMLTIDGKEISVKTVEWKLNPNKIDPRHGPCVTIMTQLKSIKGEGKLLPFRLFQDGTVDLVKTSRRAFPIKHLEIKGDLLTITYHGIKDHVTTYPLYPKELKKGIKYEASIEVKGKGKTHILYGLREKHGYDNVEKLRNEIEAGKVYLRIEFDNGMQAYCANKELALRIPRGVEKVTSYTVIEAGNVDRMFLELIEMMHENAPPQAIRDMEGKIGEHLARDEKMEEMREYISKMLKIPKNELEFGSLRRKGPDWPVEHGGEIIGIVEVKSTIKPERFKSLIEAAEDKLINRYFSGEYGRGEYSNVKHGFAVAVCFDPQEALATGKRIKIFDAKYVPNPFIATNEEAYI